MKFQLHKRKTFLYFIPISEVNAYLKQIKVLLPTMTKISYFFTSEEYDLYFFTAANRAIRQFRALFLPEKIWNASFMSGITLRMYARQIKHMTSHFDVIF